MRLWSKFSRFSLGNWSASRLLGMPRSGVPVFRLRSEDFQILADEYSLHLPDQDMDPLGGLQCSANAEEAQAGVLPAGCAAQCNWILDQLCPVGRPPAVKCGPPFGSNPVANVPGELVAKLQRGDPFVAATL